MFKKLTRISVDYPKVVLILSIMITMFFGFMMRNIKVDTDPENMLSKDDPARLFHDEVKERFGIKDFIVLGIKHDETILNSETLKRVDKVTEAILDIEGVIGDDVISPSTTNNVVLGADNGIVVGYIMPEDPDDQEAIEKLKRDMTGNAMLEDLMLSKDQKLLTIFIPIEQKDMSKRIADEIEAIANKILTVEDHYLTGLPVAEDTFGNEMFVQMGITAPMAGLVIFLIMLYFFKRASLVSSPMIIAVMSIVWTMGLLIGTGNTVHIMSSMIPIFLMPIAVVDSVHVLSEFHDNYSKFGNKRETLLHVMDELFMPMLYTSLTSAAGFASLGLTPIPPVKIFGVFVAFGIAMAWILTIMFVPAYIMLFVSEKSIKSCHTDKDHQTKSSKLITLLKKTEGMVNNHGKTILALTFITALISVYGITKINVNDNPVRWFKPSHKIRVADRVLNEHMGGTYMPFLVLTGTVEGAIKEPEVMKYIDNLQEYLRKLPHVGKTTSIADIVKRVNYILHEEDPAYNVVPDTRAVIAACIDAYENLGDPTDLENFIDYEYSSVNIWIQSKKGDNKVIEAIVNAANEYIEKNPLPGEFSVGWAGLSFINIKWQAAMVGGMLKSLLGSFVIVFVLMAFLFRSPVWGFISMIPLSITILFTYGVVGLAGKDYDMPTAVLSSLTLGLSVDFAIHFIERFRQKYKETKNFKEAADDMFAEPARAIVRNAVIVAVGFLPLLFASLVPYRTVGMFLATIMVLSCLSTLLLLLPFISIARKWLGLK